MSESLASYAFLPWLRRGIAREIKRVDGTLTGAARAQIPITLQLKADNAQYDIVADIGLFGPGEVGGIDARLVIRCNPMPNELDAEPNYFPAVEFDQPDFPWRYTPARADANGRLRPWLVLAVLRVDEIASEAAADGGGKLAEITVASADALPILAQSWAWAHVQVDGLNAGTETLASIADEAPERLRSRLVAARRLAPRTRYRAFLVPAFERGRRAGLTEPLDETLDALLPAWTAAQVNIRLPVYYTWIFQTGDKGDFEYLARKLRARTVDSAVGARAMDVSAPDPALPPAATSPLGLEGALMSPAAVSTQWPAAERTGFVIALASLLNRPADALTSAGGDHTVAPPLWAQWQAARNRLEASAGAAPPWFHELNSDPRLRVAAGLGAEVVRRNDQQLMAEAWNQVEGVLEANAELRRAQLSREASEKLHKKNLIPFETDTFLEITAPLHARFMASPVTIHEVLRRSPVPVGALDGQMRRIRRAGGTVGRRIRRLREGRLHPLLERLNSGDVRPRPAISTPEHMVSIGRINVPLGRITASKDYVPAATAAGAKLPVAPPKGSLSDAERNAAVARFNAARADLISEITAKPKPGPTLLVADLAALRNRLIEQSDPRVTIPAAITARLKVADWVKWTFQDPLEPIMAAPYFDMPMYEPLRDLSHAWLMPGVGRIPADTATIVVSNQRFIEAYMAGLSHEMGRELLYHEYPTDQRGTYFYQFWDVRGAVGPNNTKPDPETLRDIKPIHLWTQPLGGHCGRSPVPPDGHIVLLIKGEVLRRYPSTLVYAVKAILNADQRRALGNIRKFPVFEGRLDPDVSFFGFDLLPEEARGHPDPALDQGWYFILQEQPTEPVFGLDPDDGHYGGQVSSWSDLRWSHLALDEVSLRNLGYVDLNADLPDTSHVVAAGGEPALAWHADQGSGASGASASDLAYITLQRPFRVAIHATDMLTSADSTP